MIPYMVLSQTDGMKVTPLGKLSFGISHSLQEEYPTVKMQ